jgi:AcrR family transcriptional regulator
MKPAPPTTLGHDASCTTPHQPGTVCAGRPRLDEVEARTQNLLKVAGELFVEFGYGKVSLEQIARAARVAVRTIYVKFGGKAGLLNAVISEERERFFTRLEDMDTDMRPIETILCEFAMNYLELVCSPRAIALQCLVIAEAKSQPEMARIFYEAAPAHTINLLTRFFSRPEIRAQFRADLPDHILPSHFLNCLWGNRFKQLVFQPNTLLTLEEMQAQVPTGLSLFLNGTAQAS